MELKYYVSILWKWSWLIALSTVIAAASSFWVTSRQPKIYMTSTTLMVGRFLYSDDPSGQDYQISQLLAQSYLQLVRRQPILEGTIEALGLNVPWQALVGKVNVQLVPGTQLLQISIQDTHPQRAKALADEIARQLILQSPTPAEDDQAEQRQFISEQLATLQAQIEEANEQTQELEKRLALENSARGIQDIQGQIETLQQKITTWRGDYADLLNSVQGSSTNSLSVVEEAAVPAWPVGPNIPLKVLMGAAIGFALAVGGALLIEYLDDTLKTEEDVERVLKLPTLGAITRILHIQEPVDHLVTLRHPTSPIAEVYRVLRTNLRFMTFKDHQPRFLITSAAPGEGKSVTASNLAVTMAYTDKQVILIDADLRRPSLHRFFGLTNQLGLTSLLLDDALPLDTALMATPVPNLHLLPSGPIPPNPAELLESEEMQARLAQMGELADVIIFDSPPLLAAADAAIIGAYSSGVILVVHAGVTRSDVVRRAKERLDQLQVRILGAVLNRLSRKRGSSGYYYYYDHYSHHRQGGDQSPETRAGLLMRLARPKRAKPLDNGHDSEVEAVEEKKPR